MILTGTFIKQWAFKGLSIGARGQELEPAVGSAGIYCEGYEEGDQGEDCTQDKGRPCSATKKLIVKNADAQALEGIIYDI